MNHSEIIAQIIEDRLIDIAIRCFEQADVVPEGRELIPGDEYFRNNVYVRAKVGMKQHVEVLRNSGLTPGYRAYGTVSAEFYGGARAYLFPLDYHFSITLEDVMSVIANQVEAKLESDGFKTGEEE